MIVAVNANAITRNAITEPTSRLSFAVKESLERLHHYGVAIHIECDHADDVKKMMRVTEEHSLPHNRIALRGSVIPDVVIDRRSAGYRGWRDAMLEIDEAHRNKYEAYMAVKARAKMEPVVCEIPQVSEDYHPLDDCKT